MKRAEMIVVGSSVMAAMVALAGCGRQGDLYLPGAARDIVTRPIQAPGSGGTPETSNSPQTVDSPEAPASPAPEVTAPEGTPPATSAPPSPEEIAKKNGAPPPKR